MSNVRALDPLGVVHGHERYRIGQDVYDDFTWCGKSVATMEFPHPQIRGFTWVESPHVPITCIACLGAKLCPNE